MWFTTSKIASPRSAVCLQEFQVFQPGPVGCTFLTGSQSLFGYYTIHLQDMQQHKGNNLCHIPHIWLMRAEPGGWHLSVISQQPISDQLWSDQPRSDHPWNDQLWSEVTTVIRVWVHFRRMEFLWQIKWITPRKALKRCLQEMSTSTSGGSKSNLGNAGLFFVHLPKTQLWKIQNLAHHFF